MKQLLLSSLLLVSLSLALASRPVDAGTHPVTNTGPSSITAGTAATFTITVDHAGSTSTTINLSSSDSSKVSVPSSVVIAAGDTQVTYTAICASTASAGSITLGATANGSTANVTTLAKPL